MSNKKEYSPDIQIVVCIVLLKPADNTQIITILTVNDFMEFCKLSRQL